MPCSTSEFSNDRHNIAGDLNLPWKKAGSLQLLHYSPSTAVMNTKNSTQHAMANKHRLNITNSQTHTKTQHSNLGTFRLVHPATCVSPSVTLIIPRHRQNASTKANYYRGGLNLGSCKMWCSSGSVPVHPCVSFTLMIYQVQQTIALM